MCFFWIRWLFAATHARQNATTSHQPPSPLTYTPTPLNPPSLTRSPKVVAAPRVGARVVPFIRPVAEPRVQRDKIQIGRH